MFAGYSVYEHQKVWCKEASSTLSKRKEGAMSIELFKELGAKNGSKYAVSCIDKLLFL